MKAIMSFTVIVSFIMSSFLIVGNARAGDPSDRQKSAGRESASASAAPNAPGESHTTPPLKMGTALMKTAEKDIAPSSGAPSTLGRRYSPSTTGYDYTQKVEDLKKGAGQRGQVGFIDDALGGGVKSGYRFNMGRGSPGSGKTYYDWTPDTPAIPIHTGRPVAEEKPKEDNDDDK